MSVLIEELKKDHSEIVATLNEVKKLGILLYSVSQSSLQRLANKRKK